MYVLGIDAGGTKTHCAVATTDGIIRGEGLAGAANHQVCGIGMTKDSVWKAMQAALEVAKIGLQDISYAVLGMAGADGEEDFQILVPAMKELLGEIPFEIVNDSWIGLYSAREDGIGVVSICGTGAGHSGQNRLGEKLTLRNLDYICGNLGGGGELVEKALHYAFRSEEGTYEKSMLETAVPGVFEVNTMEQVCSVLRNKGITAEQEFKLPILVFELARKGDEVSRKLISNMGYEEGRYAAAIIRRLGMEKEEVPVVLIGSLFKTREPLLLDSYLEAVGEVANKAYTVIPEVAPVVGAIRMACHKVRGQFP